MNDDTRPRWRIRRTRTGRWAVFVPLVNPLGGDPYIYAPVGEWPTRLDAIAYATRTQTSNYGRAA